MAGRDRNFKASRKKKRDAVTGKFVRTLDGAEAARLRASGYSWREIGDKMGCAYGAARQRALAYLSDYAAERKAGVEEFRRIQLRRLDMLTQRAMVIVHADDETTPNKLRAMDTLVKLEERRAKLLGLDAPAKTVLTDTDGNEYTQDDAREQLAAAIARLAGEVAVVAEIPGSGEPPN
jgi:hypothetical protein